MGAMRRIEASMGKISGWVLGVESTRLFNRLDIKEKMNDEKYGVDSAFWPEQLSHESGKDQTIPLLCLRCLLIL